MMKLFERHVQNTQETLPEIPKGITVPDDISGLEATGDRQAGTQVRWLRWAAPAAVLAAGALVGVLVVTDNGTSTTEVDVVQQAEQVPSGSPFDAVVVVPQAEQVPSGSPFDAVVEVTEEVPSGSPFDAPLGG
jgi:hypothetical protein